MSKAEENTDAGTEPDAEEPESGAVALDADDTTTESVDPPGDSDRRARAVAPAWWAAIVLAVLLIASIGVASWLYFARYQPDRQLGSDAEQAALTAAADGAVAVLSYAPNTLDKDFASAKSHLTGDFLSYYTDFTQKVVTPAAKQKEVQTSAAVVRKGIMSITPDSAEVLVFLNQTTISKSNPDGAFSMSSVKIGLEKHNGHWLIASFDPV
ncbi:twin-arginine translocation pathway signal [Mycobacterium sp. pUA109]|uniref:twin-arginine translocation pathway signal n=1 Tax=Mycobacterium sp. pUA109 TaxID=3238982 RepID=UPI00351BCA3C